MVIPSSDVDELEPEGGFDGSEIPLEGDRVLVADGVFDFPFGDGHGKRQKLSEGEAVGDELAY